MLEWAATMTWKGIDPSVELGRTVYAKGITLIKGAMKKIEARLERSSALPKWTSSSDPISGKCFRENHH